MNFIRYEKTQLVIGDSDPKKLQNMVDGYRHKGYNVSNDLNQMFNRYKTSRPVYYKIISLQHQLNRAPGFEPGGWRFESFQRDQKKNDEAGTGSLPEKILAAKAIKAVCKLVLHHTTISGDQKKD